MISKPDTVLVLDFGGQYCHLIGRRIRENNVYSEVVPFDISKKEIEDLGKKFNIKGIILSGGPASIYKKSAYLISKEIFELSLPILGLCYGHQLIAYLMGGKVVPAKKREYGSSVAKIYKRKGIFLDLKEKEKVWMSHEDTVLSLPSDFEILAETENCQIASFQHKKRPIFGIQWHPEVSHTKRGAKILKNFIFNICHCQRNWKPINLIEKLILEIKEEIGNEKAVVAVSGGIDSTVATILASKALGKNLTAIFVDTGLMREGESREIIETFKKFNLNFITLNEKERFLKKLKGVRDPEMKRKIIGREFIRVFEKTAKKLKASYLIQGTIYPDRIESGMKRSDKIKTHHNVGGLPNKIKFKKIIEPLRDLYKDEVRKIGEKMGLGKEIVFRQPFPGPGLAIRIIGEVTEIKIKILRKADKILKDEIERENLSKKLWQHFPVLLEEKTTGIKGDQRAYGRVIALRIVESQEAMTSNFSKIAWEVLERISTRITNEIPEIVRVVYDITNKPPSTIEWE